MELQCEFCSDYSTIANLIKFNSKQDLYICNECMEEVLTIAHKLNQYINEKQEAS